MPVDSLGCTAVRLLNFIKMATQIKKILNKTIKKQRSECVNTGRFSGWFSLVGDVLVHSRLPVLYTVCTHVRERKRVTSRRKSTDLSRSYHYFFNIFVHQSFN